MLELKSTPDQSLRLGFKRQKIYLCFSANSALFLDLQNHYKFLKIDA